MSRIAKKALPNCAECPLANPPRDSVTGKLKWREVRGVGTRYFVRNEVVRGARIAAVGMAPAREEVENGHVFFPQVDKKGNPQNAGGIYEGFLSEAGLSRKSDVSTLNLLGCECPTTRKGPNDWTTTRPQPQYDEEGNYSHDGPSAVECCRPLLEYDLKRAKPHLIVTLGAEPLKELDPRATGKLSLQRGLLRVIDSEQSLAHGKALLPTFHPAYILRRPIDELIEQMAGDFKYMKELLRGHKTEAGIKSEAGREQAREVTGTSTSRSTGATGSRSRRRRRAHYTLVDRFPQQTVPTLDVETWVSEASGKRDRLRCIGFYEAPAAVGGRGDSSRIPKAGSPNSPVSTIRDADFGRSLEQLEGCCGHHLSSDLFHLRKAELLPRSWKPRQLICTMTLQAFKNETVEGALAPKGPKRGFQDFHSKCRDLWKKKIDPEDEDVFQKNAIDVVVTHEEKDELLGWLKTEPKLEWLYWNYAQHCIRLATEMQVNGMWVAPSIFKELSKDLKSGKIIDEIAAKDRLLRKWTEAPEDTNVNSTYFKLFALFGGDECPKPDPFLDGGVLSAGFDPIQRTDNENKYLRKCPGKTNREHLALLVDQVGTMRQRRIRKLYYDLTFLRSEKKELMQVVAQTPAEGGMTHPRWNFGGKGQDEEEGEPVHTFRWSAQEWNPQKAGEWVKEHVRSRWDEGYLVNADAKAIEPRVAYEYSKDPVLLDWFGDPDGIDGYIRASDVSFPGRGADFRQEGKRVFLSFIFGAEWKTIYIQYNNDLRKAGKKASLSESQAQQMHKSLTKALKIHHEWIEDTWATIRRTLQVENMAGLVRHLDDARARKYSVKTRARNQGINFPIQSLANMINTSAAIAQGYQWKQNLLIGMVHDSSLTDCPDRSATEAQIERTEKVWKNIKKHMKKYTRVELAMPYVVDIEVGRYWKPMIPARAFCFGKEP